MLHNTSHSEEAAIKVTKQKKRSSLSKTGTISASDGLYVRLYFQWQLIKMWQEMSSYPVEDGLNFTGIGFPTPISQIIKLERQTLHLAINVFGWEKEWLIVHRLSEKEGRIPSINLMLIKNHYTFVRRLRTLLHNQSKHVGMKKFFERGLHSYTTAKLLERHKPECMGYKAHKD